MLWRRSVRGVVVVVLWGDDPIGIEGKDWCWCCRLESAGWKECVGSRDDTRTKPMKVADIVVLLGMIIFYLLLVCFFAWYSN